MSGVLWIYRNTTRTPKGETPFTFTYGTKAVIPVEIEALAPFVLNFSQENNEEGKKFDLHLIEKKRKDA